MMFIHSFNQISLFDCGGGMFTILTTKAIGGGKPKEKKLHGLFLTMFIQCKYIICCTKKI